MSDFLKKLKEAVESGKPNEAIKAGFNEIVAKADGYAASPQTMKELQEKAEKISDEKGEEVAKKLTLEEVNKLNELAKEEENRMLIIEQKTMVTSAIIAVTCEIEKLELEIEEAKRRIEDFKGRKKELESDTTYAVKKVLIDRTINDINS